MKRYTAERQRAKERYDSCVIPHMYGNSWRGIAGMAKRHLLSWPKGNPRNGKLKKLRKFNVMAIRLQGFCMHAM